MATVSLTIRIDENDKKSIEQLAKEDDRSISYIVNQAIKEYIKKNKPSTVEFLKQFERKKRLQIVDILRGAKPLYINFAELQKIGEVLNISNEELFNLWKNIFTDYLEEGNFDVEANKALLDAMFNGAKKYAVSKK